MPDKFGFSFGGSVDDNSKQSYPTMMYPHHIVVGGMEVACHTQLARLSPRGIATIR